MRKERQKSLLKTLLSISIVLVGCLSYVAVKQIIFPPLSHSLSSQSSLQRSLRRNLLDSPEIERYNQSCEETGYPPPYPLVGTGALTCEQLKQGGVVYYLLGIMYMFLALAIVCDDFFVPSLEVMAVKLKLSDDVAGATLMAAGGSAPELFTSLLGVFVAKSEVGFGTIVGSAVFNVLFVIGMCAMFAKEVLVLTWWPLARDCTYYAISLAILAYFFRNGGDTKEIIWWESLTLILMYALYVVIMSFNEQIHKAVVVCLSKVNNNSNSSCFNDKGSHGSDTAESTTLDVENQKLELYCENDSANKFRAGVIRLMTSDKTTLEIAGVYVVSKIEGNATETFNKISSLRFGEKSSPNTINFEEFVVLLSRLGDVSTYEERRSAFDAIDSNGNGLIEKKEFCDWYETCEANVALQRNKAFALIDTNQNQSIEKDELEKVVKWDTSTLDSEVDEAFEELDLNQDGIISKAEFETWYDNNLLYQTSAQSSIELESHSDEGSAGYDRCYPPYPKEKSFWSKILFIVSTPLNLLLFTTIPNVHRPKFKSHYVSSFVLSILWIGIFSYFMVWWASVLGDAVGIPPEVMGLTFLAAGTSVPDLISSVIVARQGKGDMAVSSSIGSNIFDILIGLPVPWLLYSLVYGRPKEVFSESLAISILVLMAMLIAVVATIAAFKWRMTKGLGAMMFVLYIVFVIQDLLRAYLR